MKNFKEVFNRFNTVKHAMNVAKEANKVALSQPKPTPTEPVSNTSTELETTVPVVEAPQELPLVEKFKKKNKENQNSEITE